MIRATSNMTLCLTCIVLFSISSAFNIASGTEPVTRPGHYIAAVFSPAVNAAPVAITMPMSVDADSGGFVSPVAVADNDAAPDPAVSITVAYNCPGCDEDLGPTIPPDPNIPGSCPSGKTGCVKGQYTPLNVPMYANVGPTIPPDPNDPSSDCRGCCPYIIWFLCHSGGVPASDPIAVGPKEDTLGRAPVTLREVYIE